MQERCNSIANALELRPSCTYPSIWHHRGRNELKFLFPKCVTFASGQLLKVSRVGGLGNKGSSCPGRILSLSAFVKALRLKILPGQLLPLFPNPPTLLTCHSTGKPGEPCRPAPPPAVPSTRGSSTSTSHRGRSDAHKLPTPGRPAGLTSQPNGHTTWW